MKTRFVSDDFTIGYVYYLRFSTKTGVWYTALGYKNAINRAHLSIMNYFGENKFLYLNGGGWFEEDIVTNSDLYNMFTIGDTTTFSAVLSDRLNKITPFVFYYPSDNPFSFSMGYGIAFNARLLHNNKMFTIMAFDKTGTQIEVKQFTIT